MLFEYLSENYADGEPIFLTDIHIDGMTEENAYVLQFLDCLKDIDKAAEENMQDCGKILTEFAQTHGITKEQVDRLLCYYPLKIYKAIYETGVEYVSA